MSYRPYPDVHRARRQLNRSRAPERPSPLLEWINQVVAPLKLAEWQRAWLNAAITVNHPKRTGRSALTAALVDQAVKAGEHVHIASLDGVRCVGEGQTCALPEAEPQQCGFIHDQWLDGVYRARRRCIAKAGHTSGQFAYDHGPWGSVPDPG